ncbi:MAG: glycosyltransferase family 4 protein [Bacteroidetes bacterium]|nr:glycosyltransferase family 4 protein [Bacteroidota bacterium]
MPRILFIGAHRLNRSPSQRFRFEQYLSFFQKNGFECHLSPLLDEKDDRRFYSEGNFFGKISVVVKSFFRRWKDMGKAKNYDIIFIQREAFMTGSIFFEKKLKAIGKKVVFDFDDAIWLPNISESNKKYEWLKNPLKTDQLISISDLVIAGNAFLADYAKKFNGNVRMIPTTIDTDYHIRRVRVKKDESICIGWTGSHTTIQHFEHAVPVLKKLKKNFGNKIYFKVIGDPAYENKELGLKGVSWKLTSEIEDLSEFDIGIMPLPDDEWAKGKCGLKGLQYMALEIPTVISPVGVNREIISEGVNGFLAQNEEEWIEKISLLIENPELRKKIGRDARKTVEERYSVNSQKEKYLSCLKDLLG